MNEKLAKDQLLQLVDKIMRPEAYGISEKEGDDVLIAFCAGCPDPVKARWLIVECLDPMTDEEIVDHALDMSLRNMTDVPTSIVPADHFTRTLGRNT